MNINTTETESAKKAFNETQIVWAAWHVAENDHMQASKRYHMHHRVDLYRNESARMTAFKVANKAKAELRLKTLFMEKAEEYKRITNKDFVLGNDPSSVSAAS